MDSDDLLEVLASTREVVAFLVGVRQQLLDAGFSPAAAETLTVAIVKSGG